MIIYTYVVTLSRVIRPQSNITISFSIILVAYRVHESLKSNNLSEAVALRTASVGFEITTWCCLQNGISPISAQLSLQVAV